MLNLRNRERLEYRNERRGKVGAKGMLVFQGNSKVVLSIAVQRMQVRESGQRTKL